MSNLKIFAETIEEGAEQQIKDLMKEEAFKNSKVRIMPDVHAGKGCVIGFTGDLGEKVIPNIVGVDIGCGMLTIELLEEIKDLKSFDDYVVNNIPSGFNVHEKEQLEIDFLKQLYCFDELKNKEHILKSLGSLGGGNHFIEVAKSSTGTNYIVIHSGSRNLGKQIAEIYKKKAENHSFNHKDLSSMKQEKIKELKEAGRQNEIEEALKQIEEENKILVSNKEFAYIEGEERNKYLHDMEIAQEFASMNRYEIGGSLANYLIENENIACNGTFETIHNYIDLESNIVRKGAISSKLNEKVLIPLNMRDGSIIAIGKGNEDWNCSAPHGAGRILSRMKAKQVLSVEEFKETMKEVYSSSVSEETLDEAPFVYKDKEEIINSISDTVEIIDIIKPVYNFKAH